MKPTPHGLHRLANRLYKRRLVLLARIVQGIIFLVFNAVLPAEVAIGKSTTYGHGGVGVVVNPGAKIGDHVSVGQTVTIGGRSRRGGLPVIEDGVYIGAGAKILGDVTIGRHSIIGANAVVIESVPPRSVAVGIPARIVRTDIEPGDVLEW